MHYVLPRIGVCFVLGIGLALYSCTVDLLQEIFKIRTKIPEINEVFHNSTQSHTENHENLSKQNYLECESFSFSIDVVARAFKRSTHKTLSCHHLFFLLFGCIHPYLCTHFPFCTIIYKCISFNHNP